MIKHLGKKPEGASDDGAEDRQRRYQTAYDLSHPSERRHQSRAFFWLKQQLASESLKAFWFPIFLFFLNILLALRPNDIPNTVKEWKEALTPNAFNIIFVILMTVLFLVLRATLKLFTPRRNLLFSLAPIALIILGYFAANQLHQPVTAIPAVRSDACLLTKGFTLLRNRQAGHWFVMYGDQIAYDFTPVELHDLYGGSPVPFEGCGGIFSGKDQFSMIVGRESDLLVAFGVVRWFGQVVGLNKLSYFAHDYRMNFLPQGDNSILIQYGWKHDLNARFCWNLHDDNKWSHNADHRAGGGPCVSDQFPWEYPVTGTQATQQSRYDVLSRDIGSLLGLNFSTNGGKAW